MDGGQTEGSKRFRSAKRRDDESREPDDRAMESEAGQAGIR
jgi:hypothetical protein